MLRIVEQKRWWIVDVASGEPLGRFDVRAGLAPVPQPFAYGFGSKEEAMAAADTYVGATVIVER